MQRMRIGGGATNAEWAATNAEWGMRLTRATDAKTECDERQTGCATNAKRGATSA